MIIETKAFQSACKTILYAVDSKDSTLLNETLELVANGDVLNLNVTNREYWCSVRFKLTEPTMFRAAVNAKLFLNLISKLATPTIEITKDTNFVKVKSSGEYKIAIIFNNDKMLELPVIAIDNVTNEMSMNSDILHSIATYNSKELTRGPIVRPVQGYYYVDEHGAVTFTSGACVNSFELEKPVKMLLSDKVVKLFKLFKPDTKISFTIGQDPINDEIIQTKVKFESDVVTITAALCDYGMIASVPVDAVRSMASKAFNYSIVVNRDDLLKAIDRIMLFNEDDRSILTVDKEKITVSDTGMNNFDSVKLENECNNITSYAMEVEIKGFRGILEGAEDQYVTICFGDDRAIVVKKSNISDVVRMIKH